jgi:rubrerythrin
MIFSLLRAPAYVPYQGYVGYFAQNESKIIQMIEQSISGEREDERFYEELIRLAPTEQQKDIITGIRNDERKHRKMLMNIYTSLTGTLPAAGEETAGEAPFTDVADGIEKALLGELKAFEKYRYIYLNIRPQFRNQMFEIMTDEMKHAGYYNWLYAKNAK